MMDFRILMGYLSAIVCITGMIVYLYAIYKGKVISNRVTWAVWVLVTAMIAFGYTHATDGAASIWVNIVYFFGTFITFLFLIFFGKPGKWTWLEKVSLFLVFVLASIWYFMELSPGVALIYTLAIDALGGLVLLKTVYHEPDTEYGPGWYLAFMANTMNLFAVSVWDWNNAAQPIYMVLLTGSVSLCILLHKIKPLNSLSCRLT